MTNYITKPIPAEKPPVALGNWQQTDITRYADDFNRAPIGG